MMYAVHPGYKQGEVVLATQIARCYGLREGEWISWDEHNSLGRSYDNYVHLFMREDYRDWKRTDNGSYTNTSEDKNGN